MRSGVALPGQFLMSPEAQFPVSVDTRLSRHIPAFVGLTLPASRRLRQQPPPTAEPAIVPSPTPDRGSLYKLMHAGFACG
jgi:hypothetical protein